MTAQIHDEVVLDEETYSIVGVAGGPLFDPLEHGMRPVAISTACWRGWYATYAVRDDHFVLDVLAIKIVAEDDEELTQDEVPRLAGVVPVRHMERYGEESEESEEWFYEAVGLPVPFTGGLLLGSGFLRELYVHMGFHPAWKYERVRELLCDVTAQRYRDDAPLAAAQLCGLAEGGRAEAEGRGRARGADPVGKGGEVRG